MLAALSLLGCEGSTEPDPVQPKILFDMVVAGNRDIYRANLDGSELERLTTDPSDDFEPTGARSTIVFSSFRDGNTELYTRSGTAAESRLTFTAANESAARLSPSGSRLAFIRDNGSTPRVFVGPASTTGAVAATTASGPTIEASPAWKASADSLVFASTGATVGGPSIFAARSTAPASPAQVAKPSTTDSVYLEPAWSVDGKSIAFVAGLATGSTRIAVLNRATNAITMVTPATISAGQPAFLSDGRIVFTVFGSGSASTLSWVDPAKPGQITTIPLTGTSPRHPAIIWP